jgi:predicted CoA-substrate-specific enzyme activase
MSTSNTRLGIDVGSLFLKMVEFGQDGPIRSWYLPHQGEPDQVLSTLISELADQPVSIGVTGTGAERLAHNGELAAIHLIEAEIAAARKQFPEARNILNVGGGSCTFINLDENGRFLNYTANSLCAAGTGSFLDEQARRLQFGYEDMAKLDYDGVPPSIASRCAVFAKSDLIHRQQEGYSREAMWAGLCKGCVDTFLQTLLRGKPLDGLTVITGGVVQNPSIMRWLTTYFGDQVVTWDAAHLSGAIGAAMLAEGAPVLPSSLLDGIPSEQSDGEAITKRGNPLILEKTDYPSFDVFEEFKDDNGNEVRLWTELKTGNIGVFLGIDIGSTSTKLVLLDRNREVLVDIYRKTDGDPVSAVKKLFVAVEDLSTSREVTFEVLGCGTTGSGRKFIGQIIGADAVINEITAHVAGAMEVDPAIDTIFEIGGQDSKYMRTVGGNIRDANMNFICAAGTGSFVEEQASKLGFGVAEIGDRVMGISPPETSDRCTVFMEEDTRALLRQGFTRVEGIAAVMNSVVKNYLNKVVGNRYISKKKVFFQGATARNKGLVAAFEQQLGVEMVVSPLCHQMGSYGVALLTAQVNDGLSKSTFRGFDLSRRTIELNKEQCDSCNNSCTITFASIEGDDVKPSWGYMCGKEPDQEKRKVNRNFSLFRKRDKLLTAQYKKQTISDGAKIVGMPYSLTMYSYLPFWTSLLNELGFKLELTRPTDEKIKNEGVNSASGDFCFPAKVAVGHALAAFENDEFEAVLIPAAISGLPNEHTSNSLLCPYVQSHPSVVKSVMELTGRDVSKLLTPIFDLRWDLKRLTKEFESTLSGPLSIRRGRMKKALEEAFKSQRLFEQQCNQEGEAALAKLKETGEKAIVIAGRPYNCFDPGANLGLPEKISEYGMTVIPIDFLPYDPEALGDRYQNIYWNYGQRILASIKTVAESEQLFAIYLSNFNCGPDSFIQTYAEHILGEKPLLILELDEHGADAGYMTRVEAFLDVVSAAGPSKSETDTSVRKLDMVDVRKRTLWIPPMHPLAGRICAGAFERFGYKAESLPPEDRQAYEIGRKVARGSECLPASVTIGALLKHFKDINADPSEHGYFMATASGPCRFGQYALLHREILDRAGYADVPILSPSSYNSYQGIEDELRKLLWFGFLTSDVLYKMLCKVRPYEKNRGDAFEVTEKHTEILRRTFAENGDLEAAVRAAAKEFAAIPVTRERKPLVGVVGEIYVRCNEFTNGHVIDHIEQYGGEAWLVPLSEWMLYTAHLQEWTAKQGVRNFTARGKSLLKNRFLFSTEHKWYKLCSPLLDERAEPPIAEVVGIGSKYLPINFEGEALITVGRTEVFAKNGVSLVVNCAPFGCMPGILTASIMQQIEKETGVPIVNMYYDGEGEINRRLEVYLHQAAKSPAQKKQDSRMSAHA